MEVLIISGISGSGKSTAASYLEDIGYYIVDNLPSQMILDFSKYCLNNQDRYSRVAFVYDIRAGEPFYLLLETIQDIRALHIRCNLLYLDADDESIIQRYKETRRNHPLAVNGMSIAQAIQNEKEMTSLVKNGADYIINSSHYSATKLRSEIISLFAKDSDKQFTVHFMSFGYKNGLPLEADLVFDTRFIKNPYYIPELKEKNGLNTEVRDYIFSFDESNTFILEVEQFLVDFIPAYRQEGKTVLIVALGCTGGKHRSVACCHSIANFIESKGYNVIETHRDIGR